MPGSASARARRFRLPVFLLRRDGLFLLGALTLLAAACFFLYLSRPTPLTVAAGPRDSPEARLVEAYAALLARERGGIRLALTYQGDVRDAAALLESGGADLAVVRPDVRTPANGLTLAVLRDEALVVLAPAATGLADMPALAKRRLGIVARHEADRAFVQAILRYYDLAPAPDGAKPAAGTVSLVTLAPEAVTEALKGDRVDAVAVVATPSSPSALEVVRAAEAAAKDGKVTFLDVSEGEAIVQRMPELQAVTVPAGAFGGRPKRPDEELKTIGVSYRLMARDTLRRETAAAVAQYLFEKRGRLAAAAPGVVFLKAPDFDSAVTATSARLANHPGAVDYFQREQLTFFQAYGDYVYLAMFGAGSVGSALAWIAQRFARKRRALVDVVLDRLMDILRESRDSRSLADLDELAHEIDGLVIHAVRYARHGKTDTHTMSALMLAIDSARATVADRRRTLGDPGQDMRATLSLAPRSAAG